jgi:hypothetical protein
MLIRLSNDSVNPRPASQRLCGHTRETGYRPASRQRAARAARGWLSSRAKRVSTGSAKTFARYSRIQRSRRATPGGCESDASPTRPRAAALGMAKMHQKSRPTIDTRRIDKKG